MEKGFAEKIKNKRRKKLASVLIFALILLVGIGSFIWYKSAGGFNGKGEPGKVSIEIRCDELSKNMDALTDEAIRDYIPTDGIILKEREVEIIRGVTDVFTVLDDVCRKENIQIEYSYIPAYGSHYVEGINYIYEFSAGKYSGWMFMVDGEAPNYGADSIILKGGERIVWYYTVDYR